MGERKVLNKYYPWDFDPKLLSKPKVQKNSQVKVRMMLPMSIMCTNCGEYIGVGTKFNSKKETVEKERYLNIDVYRFYMRCSRCSAEFTIKTDPKNSDYVAEFGCKRCYEPWKEHEEKVKEQESAEQEVQDDAIKQLENKTQASKNEMDLLDDLDEIKSLNAEIETLSTERLLQQLRDPNSHVSDNSDDANSKNQDKLRISDLTQEEREKLNEFFGSDSSSSSKSDSISGEKPSQQQKTSNTSDNIRKNLLQSLIENGNVNENEENEENDAKIPEIVEKNEKIEPKNEEIAEKIEKTEEITTKNENNGTKTIITTTTTTKDNTAKEEKPVIPKTTIKATPAVTTDLFGGLGGLGDLDFEVVDETEKKKKKKKSGKKRKREQENEKDPKSQPKEEIKQVQKKAR